MGRSGFIVLAALLFMCSTQNASAEKVVLHCKVAYKYFKGSKEENSNSVMTLDTSKHRLTEKSDDPGSHDPWENVKVEGNKLTADQVGAMVQLELDLSTGKGTYLDPGGAASFTCTR